MHASPKIAFIGAGNMGGAIIRGLISAKTVTPCDITICCKSNLRHSAFREMGVNIALSVSEAIRDASYIFLCVKPKDIASVVSDISSSANLKENAILVSIAASVSTSMICDFGNKAFPVIRTMPGMPLLIGEGTVAISRNHLVADRSYQYICRLFSSIALISVMEEEQMNAIISVNGSSPAYVFYMIKSMVEGAQEQGIDPDRALPLILQTIIGTAKMLENTDLSIDDQIARICSSRGTTIAAMDVLRSSDFSETLKRAMNACTQRADEISKELST